MRMDLKLLVLHFIAKEPETGYSLMKKIGEFRGRKPSSGSMYPVLNELKRKGFIKSEGGMFCITDIGNTERHVLIKELDKEISDLQSLYERVK